MKKDSLQDSEPANKSTGFGGKNKNSNGTSIMLVAILLTVLYSTVTLAYTSVLDQQQTAGGASFGFYIDGGNTHKWAGQQFQPSKVFITSIDLRLRMNYDNSISCRGALNKIDVEIKESANNGNDMGDTVAYAYNFEDFCYLPPRSFTWREIPLTQTKDIDTSKKYWIAVNYRGGQTGFSALDWEKATYDANPALRYKIPGNIMGDYDLTFKTYGYTPPCYNTASWQCKDDMTYGYLNGNCEWESLTTCTANQHCENSNGCVGNTNVGIVSVETADSGSSPKSSFNNGETINLISHVQNTGAYGPFRLLVEILQGSSIVYSNQWSTTNLNNGEAMKFTDTTTIPNDWNGVYTMRSTSDTCYSPSQCSIARDFSVSAPCTDNDGDGSFANCGSPVDCNDNNANAKPGLAEVCSDNIDNDCNGAVDELCEPSVVLEGIWSLHENNSIDTSFKRNENMKFGIQVRNNGAEGTYDSLLIIKKDGAEVQRISTTKTIGKGIVQVVYPYFFIPNDWQGEYTYDVSVSPCSPPTQCSMSKSFTVDVPVLNLDGIWTLTDDNAVTGTFQQNQNMKFGAQITNNGPQGDYSYTLDVYYDGSRVHHHDDRGIINPAITKVAYHYFFIPANFEGTYQYTVRIEPCVAPQACSLSKAFTVGDDCIDNDNDGFCTNEGQVDCNDESPGVNSVASEVCDGIDNNCAAGVDEGFDLQSDSLNCGACGIACGIGQMCQAGTCVSSASNTTTDTTNNTNNDTTNDADTTSDIDYSSIIGRHALVPIDLMLPIAGILASEGRVHEVFYTNETESNASKIVLANVVSLSGATSDTVSYVLLNPEQLEILIDNEIITRAARASADNHLKITLKYADGIDDVVFLQTDASRMIEEDAAKLMSKTHQFINHDLKNLNNALGGALAIYSTYQATDGNINDRFAILLPVNIGLAMSDFPPFLAIRAIKVGKDVTGGIGSYTFSVIGFDPEKLSCNINATNYLDPSVYVECRLNEVKKVWDFVGSIIDVIVDKAEHPEEAFWGHCGIFNGQVLTCLASIGEGIDLFTHPIPIIKDIDTGQYGRTIVFQEHLQDENFFQPLSHKIWVGASVMTDNQLGCVYDLPPQEIEVSKEEELDLTFQWASPEGYPKEQPIEFVSQVWHSCVDCRDKDAYCFACATSGNLCDACVQCGRPLPYTQCNPSESNNFRCSVNNFSTLNYALSGIAINFTIENQPPIINDIKLNNLSYRSIFYEGEVITIDVYVTDIDQDTFKDTLTLTYSLSSSTSGGTVSDSLEFQSCKPNGLGNICTFAWRQKAGSAGRYTLTFIADDGYDSTEQSTTLRIYRVACYGNSKCGVPTVNGRSFCSSDGKDALQTVNLPTCRLPGSPSSSCYVQQKTYSLGTCTRGCTNGKCRGWTATMLQQRIRLLLRRLGNI